MDVHELLRRLASKRPLFHSEADFQHALAWEIHDLYPAATIRLERPVEVAARRGYLDLFVAVEGKRTGIELKYWTRALHVDQGGELYALRNQAAQDVSRYDFCKDLARVEALAEAGTIDEGYVVALTNDQGYWRQGRPDTVDAAFRLHDRRVLTGSLAWTSDASAGTMRRREEPLHLRGQYELRWHPFSQVQAGSASVLQYLGVGVT